MLSHCTAFSLGIAVWKYGYEQGRSYLSIRRHNETPAYLAPIACQEAEHYLDTLRHSVMLSDDICERIFFFFVRAFMQAILDTTTTISPYDTGYLEDHVQKMHH